MKLKEELYDSCREGAAGRVKAILLKNPELINQVRHFCFLKYPSGR
jgi:hypothetical protein